MADDSTGPLAELILARLAVPSASRPANKKLHADVAPLFAERPSSERVEQVVAALRAAGLVLANKLTLTDAGSVRALAYLGVKALPPRVRWQTIRNNYLVPRALGLTPGSEDSLKRIDKSDKLAARLVKLKAGLPSETPDGLPGVFEALVCRALGFADQVSLKAIREAVVYGKLTELTQSSGRTSAALRDLALAGAFVDARDESLDLAAFARAVNEAAGRRETPRFGANKVFISHVWKQLNDEPGFDGMELDDFKSRLVEANRAGLVRLVTADMKQALGSTDLRESATEQHPSLFHFIRTGESE